MYLVTIIAYSSFALLIGVFLYLLYLKTQYDIKVSKEDMNIMFCPQKDLSKEYAFIDKIIDTTLQRILLQEQLKGKSVNIKRRIRNKANRLVDSRKTGSTKKHGGFVNNYNYGYGMLYNTLVNNYIKYLSKTKGYNEEDVKLLTDYVVRKLYIS